MSGYNVMIVRNFSFINADLESVSDAICQIESDHNVKKVAMPLSIDLSCVHYRTPVGKLFLWSPDKCRTAMFGNQGDGFYTLCCILCHRYGFDITSIALTLYVDIEAEQDYYEFREFSHQFSDGRDRYVRVMQDPRWDFFERGEPFPFEQTEKYTERIKKKRLTNDMILDYVEAMGYDVRNPDFWKSDNAVYLEWTKYIAQ